LNALIRTEALGSTGISTSFADGSGGWGDAIGGALERGDVDALQLHHRVEGASCAGRFGMPMSRRTSQDRKSTWTAETRNARRRQQHDGSIVLTLLIG
jgi:hypothetical protein